MTIDDLRDLLARPGQTDDEGVLAFYAWKEGEEWADMLRDETQKHVVATLTGWFLKGLPPVTIRDVVEWLKDWFDPDAIGGTEDELRKLVARFLAEKIP